MYILFLSLKINFILTNSEDTGEMPHEVFTVCQYTHLGVSGLQRGKAVVYAKG